MAGTHIRHHMDNTLVSAVKNNKVFEVEGFLAAGASPDECDYDVCYLLSA